jgi:chromosome segregation ATPase
MSNFIPRSRLEEETEKLVERVMTVETRLAVLETRAEAWERRMLELHASITKLGADIKDAQSEMRKAMEYVSSMLRVHIDQEAKDRNKVLFAAVTAFGGGLLSLLAFLGSHVWTTIFP